MIKKQLELNRPKACRDPEWQSVTRDEKSTSRFRNKIRQAENDMGK